MIYIFYYDWCGYSKRALQHAKTLKIPHKKMNMTKLGGLEDTIKLLKQQRIMKKNSTHKTAPIIFEDDKLIGGFNEFQKKY